MSSEQRPRTFILDHARLARLRQSHRRQGIFRTRRLTRALQKTWRRSYFRLCRAPPAASAKRPKDGKGGHRQFNSESGLSKVRKVLLAVVIILLFCTAAFAQDNTSASASKATVVGINNSLPQNYECVMHTSILWGLFTWPSSNRQCQLRALADALIRNGYEDEGHKVLEQAIEELK